ncbi:hypothetical protein PIIN_06225 [Serendipita indica DSM 11827]|uniref:Uncharacterized protein n=1 Tax=Serendipita indica (strain DSM 11827) TaxID=1109443 RepID=G4TLU8_SERID|nr:hypothetical protein PIIN_06225 [Serendipita indica DSM 11827]
MPFLLFLIGTPGSIQSIPRGHKETFSTSETSILDQPRKAYYQYIGSLPTYLPTQHADRSSFNSKAKRNRHGSQDTRRGTRPPGFYNRRGDKFIRRGVIRRQSNPAMEWHQVFDGYPDPGQGWMDEDGNWLPEQGGILKH